MIGAFKKKFCAWVVSLFLLAAFALLGACTVKIGVAFWIRFSNITGGEAVCAALKSHEKSRSTKMLTLEPGEA